MKNPHDTSWMTEAQQAAFDAFAKLTPEEMAQAFAKMTIDERCVVVGGLTDEELDLCGAALPKINNPDVSFITRDGLEGSISCW